jgi:acetyl-CoA acetyltransferase
MKEIAIVGYQQSQCVSDAGALNEVELIIPVIGRIFEQVGITNAQDVDFVCSGSCDYLQGALGAVPPIKESHVEMDAAWALYESILKIRMGHADSALIYGFGKSSPGELPIVLSQQLDPYYLAPQWVDTISLAALQARLMLDQGLITERDMAEVVARSRRNAMNNPNAQLKGDVSADDILAEETYLSPLRRSDCCPVSDGASAMVICTVEKAKEWGKPYAVISGIDHIIESHNIGMRDITDSPSTRKAAERAGMGKGKVDVAELYAPFSHQEIILTRALGLGDDTSINPSGGVLAGNLMMASGLSRIGEVFNRIVDGEAERGVAHTTSGPCLQHNLVTVIEKGEAA